MSAQTLIIGRTSTGWAVYLSSGRELVRYRGPGARVRAVAYARGFGR